MSASHSIPNKTSNIPHPQPPGAARGFLWRGVTAAIPNLVVFGTLAAVFVLGHRTGWKLLSSPAFVGSTARQPDDWCPEHLVPESVCVECNEALLPKPQLFGFCPRHGVAECVLDHPELAQINGSPQLPRYDALPALALLPRTENNSRNMLHRHRLQLTSNETLQKAGIEVDVVHEQPMVEALTANGELTFDPTRVAHLSSRLPGTVTAVFKTIGADVAPGEILALVDARQVGEAKSELLTALVRRRLRRTTLERLHGVGESSVPVRMLTEAESALQEAEIACLSARQSLVNLGFEVPERLDAQDAKKIAEEIRFLGIPEPLLKNLATTARTANLLPLRTPYRGTIVASDIVAGEVVDASKLLVTVADPRQLWLLLSVRQEDASRVAVGQPVVFRTDDRSRALKGKVAWIGSTIDERTRTLQVRVILQDETRLLRDKTFGTGRIILREEPHAVVVPRESVQPTEDAQFVFVRDKDFLKPGTPKVFHVRQVRVGARDEKSVELLAGVLPGEVVATKGSPALLAQLLRSNLGAGCGCHEH